MDSERGKHHDSEPNCVFPFALILPLSQARALKVQASETGSHKVNGQTYVYPRGMSR